MTMKKARKDADILSGLGTLGEIRRFMAEHHSS